MLVMLLDGPEVERKVHTLNASTCGDANRRIRRSVVVGKSYRVASLGAHGTRLVQTVRRDHGRSAARHASHPRLRRRRNATSEQGTDHPLEPRPRPQPTGRLCLARVYRVAQRPRHPRQQGAHRLVAPRPRRHAPPRHRRGLRLRRHTPARPEPRPIPLAARSHRARAIVDEARRGRVVGETLRREVVVCAKTSIFGI